MLRHRAQSLRTAHPGRLLPLCAMLLILVSTGTSSAGIDLGQKLDTILRQAYPADGPGAAAIVLRDGQVLLREGYGLADLEFGLPIAPDMVFRIGSVTKQFTAVAILMLMEEGKLSLDDPIEAFLPDYPTHGLTITIEHLLTHTSGIQSYTAMPTFQDLQRQDYTVAEMIARFQDEPMAFPPGARWSYNNSGYFLLGAIIEQVTGQTWAEVLQERIFTPLGMTDTYADGHEDIIPRRVHGYELKDEGRWKNAGYLSMTQPYAAGAMLSTVDDLARWDAALNAGELLEPATLDRAWTDFPLNDGSSTGYGHGWTIGQWQGSRWISHGGGINGFLCEAVHCPDEQVFVAVLANSSGQGPGPGQIASKLATIAMGKPWEPKEVAVAPDILQRYVGVYRIDAQATRTVTLEDGVLFTQRSGASKLRARPMSATSFFYDDSFSHFTIDLDAQGMVLGMTMHRLGGGPEYARLTDEEPITREVAALDPSTIDRYLGRFELAPEFILTIAREGDQLLAQATGQPQLPIFPESDTRFFLTEVDAQIVFELEDGGRATGLTLHQAGRQLPARRLAD